MKQKQVNFEGWDADKHYSEVVDWWLGHKTEPLPACMLPCYGAFAVDEHGTRKVCAWLTKDEVNQTAHMDWIVSNPDNTLKETLEYVGPLVGMLQDLAEQDGILWFFGVTDHEKIAEQALKLGVYDVVEPACARMFKILATNPVLPD